MSVSAANTGTTTPRLPIDPGSTLLFAAVLFGVSVRTGPGVALAAIVATALLIVWFWNRGDESWLDPGESGKDDGLRLLGAVLIFGVLGALAWSPSTIGPTTAPLEHLPGVLWAIAGVPLYWLSHRVEPRRLAVGATVLTLSLTAVVSLMHLNQVEGLGLDVHVLHIAAADAITNGQNPYTDAVEIEDGSPDAQPGDTIVGYPYPPVTAIAYAIGSWIFSEPRVTSLLAWMILLALFGVHSYRNRTVRSLFLMLMLASLPGWPLVLRGSWTEPLTLMLVALAFFVWRKATLSGLALGFGLASKQYFIVSAPIALLHRDEGWLRRLLTAFAVVGLTIGAALLLDFSAFWTAAVEFHTSTSPRFDSSNLIGLLSGLGYEWTPPRLLGLVVGLIAATLTGRLSRSAATFVVATALALASSFLVSTQAFANYWYLVFGLCVLGLVDVADAEPPTPPRPPREAPASTR